MKWRAIVVAFTILVIASCSPCLAQLSGTGEAIDIGSRRELMVDDYLSDSLQGAATHRLHHPVRREIAVVHDEPWEGNGGGYHTVFYDPGYKETGRYRMYYHAWHIPSDGQQNHPLYIGYCESKDGIHWEKPELGLHEFNGSKSNNIVMATINGKSCHDLSVFKDTNPNAEKGAEYKAVGRGQNPTGLYAFKSPDGIHWTAYNDSKPVMTGHPFDTQNLAFWDPNIGKFSRLRRYSLRLDGFASVFAPRDGGKIVTKPLTFSGNTLNINFATSAAGSIRVEIQDAAGKPIDGYALADSKEAFGDASDYAVRWKQGTDVGSLAGRSVRLRFVLREADLYALQFAPAS